MNTHLIVENKSWFNRIKEAISGVPLGIFYLIVATIVLIYGEKNHAKTTNLLKRTTPEVNLIDNKKINPIYNSQLILLTDSIVTDGILTDTLFGIKGQYLRLYRQVKMYQWQEIISTKTTEKRGGRKTDSITYSYKKVWNTKLIDSKKFKFKDFYINPTHINFKSAEFSFAHIKMGAYTLSNDIISELKKYIPIVPSIHTTNSNLTFATDTFQCLGSEVASNAAIYGDYMLNGEYIYLGKGTPQNPEIGDYKFVYWAVEPSLYSIIAQQNFDTIGAKMIKDGFAMSELNCGTNFNYETNKFLLVKSGKNDKSEMYAWAHDNNDILFIFGLRLWGLLFMLAGFKNLFKPIALIPAWIPVIGRYSGKIIMRLAFLLGTTITFLIAGITWLIYNNFDNITKWDYYFVILVALIFIGTVRVRASMGEHSVDSNDLFTI